MRNRHIVRFRQLLTLAALACTLFSGPASAEYMVITGFTKIVDGTTAVPEDPTENFYHGYFYPATNNHPFPLTEDLTLSHDGTNTAFLGCTANAANTACEQNEFGAYYGDGSSVTLIRNYYTSNAIPALRHARIQKNHNYLS